MFDWSDMVDFKAPRLVIFGKQTVFATSAGDMAEFARQRPADRH